MSSLSGRLRTDDENEAFSLEAARNASREEALRIIEEAEVIGVPWRQVLKQEILAEGMLQRFLGAPIRDLPLWRALSIIPNSLLHSWRVRDLVDRLCHEAAAESSRSARRELASLVESLSGPQARRTAEGSARAWHYRFAYDRILELHAVALAAERGGRSGAARAHEIVETTGCSRADSDWAVARLASPSRGHALDDAVRRAREEGFEIPVAASELQAFSRLKRYVSRHRPFRTRRPNARRNPAKPGRAARSGGDDLRKVRDDRP